MSTTRSTSKSSFTARHGLSRPPLTVKSHNVMMQMSSAYLPPRIGTSGQEMPHANFKNANGQTMPTPASNLRNSKGQLVSPRLANTPVSYTTSVAARDRPWERNRDTKGIVQEDIATPVKSFLSSNITPRSGSRKSRLDSPSSTPGGTPNGTPSHSRPISTISTSDRFPEDAQEMGLGLRKVGAVRTLRSGSITSNSNGSILSSKRASPDRELQGFKAGSPDNTPMFFHANDINPTLSSKSITTNGSISQSKIATFTYANGERELDIETSSSNATSPLEMQPSKFIYANGTLDSGAEKPKPLTVTLPYSSRDISIVPHHTGPQHRPPSPMKEGGVTRKSSISKASPRQHVSLASKGAYHQFEQKPPGPFDSTASGPTRRSSLKMGRNLPVRHGKSSSVSSIDSIATPRKPLPFAANKSTYPLESRRASIAAEPLPLTKEPHTTEPKSPLLSMPTSPTKPTTTESRIDHLNELAANARRERKVLDLEISNSSLLAINRTLEREMRKQNAELRRYRRLTQTGRLSIAPSNRSTFTRLSTFTSTTNAGSDFSDQDDTLNLDLDFELSDDDIDSSLSVTTPRSPASQSAYDARQRAKDEKCLQLDLSKHQELLIDSQKINQSLKRCLGWTEELITEGKKALNYQVQLSDVEVRGRVLTPDEVEGDVSHRRGLLSPGDKRIAVPNPLESTASYRGSFIGVDDDDRDEDRDIADDDDDGVSDTIPTPGEDTRENGETNNTSGFRDYLDSFGVSWGV